MEEDRVTADASPPAPRENRRQTALQRLVQAERHEVGPLLWSTAFFFCVLAGYFVLRPVRETWGIEVGPHYHLLWTGTAIGTLLATPVFGLLVARLPRRRSVPLVYAAGIVCLVLFWVACRATTGSVRVGVGYAFYVWLSVFNLFSTAVFWAFMVDVWRESQSRRLFGVVAAGGTLGALFGGLLASAGNGTIGIENLLLVAAVLYLLANLCIAGLVRLFGPEPPRALRTSLPRVGWHEALAGVRLLARSRYLTRIGLFLVAQTLVASVLYIESRTAVGAMFPTSDPLLTPDAVAANREARMAFFVRVDVAYNALALLVQLFLTGRLVRWVGLGAMLAFLPLVNFAGFAMLALAPTVVAYGVFEVLQRGSRFAVMKPAREVLFTVLERDEKYQAKQFLDTAVYRSSDAVWAWLQAAMVTLLGSFGLKVIVVLPVCLAWTGVGHWLGREESRRAGGAAGPAPGGAYGDGRGRPGSGIVRSQTSTTTSERCSSPE